MRCFNILGMLIFNYLVIVDAKAQLAYFLVLFYVWVLIIVSIIEIGYVINGDKALFNRYKKTNTFFLFFYFLSVASFLFHIIRFRLIS